MILSSQQRFFLILVALSLLWLLMVSVQLSRVDRIYRNTPIKDDRINRISTIATDTDVDDELPEWAEVMLHSDAERKQFQRYAAARRAEERDVKNRMREIRQSSQTQSAKQEVQH
jgi:hypothetical protein